MAVDVSLMLSLPLERAFAPFIDEADGQHAEEGDYRPKAQSADTLEGDGPGKQEGDLEVEDDEQDGNEIIAHVEPAAGVVERVEAAFIGRQLLGVGLLMRRQQRAAQHEGGYAAGDDQKHQNRQIAKKQW